MERLIIEIFGAVIAAAAGFYYGYSKCKRDNHIR